MSQPVPMPPDVGLTVSQPNDGPTLPRLSASDGALGLLVNRLLYEGLVLYGHGNKEKAIARWRKVLLIDPRQTKASGYLALAGAPVHTNDTPVPNRVMLRVHWSSTAIPADALPLLPSASDDARHLGQQELYEVLYDRALRALRARAWDLARVLLKTCVHRRPDDARPWRLLEVVREQLERQSSARDPRDENCRAA